LHSPENPLIDVLIPAFNEEKALPLVLAALPRDRVRRIVVCDNGSTDGTAAVAAAHGATVVSEPRRGYGRACLAGMAFLSALPPAEQPGIVVFLDGDYSDFPEELPLLIAPIVGRGQDLVIGSRRLGGLEPGAMTVPQRFGNWLAPALIRLRYGYRFTDLGPFRAIRWPRLLELDMRDPNFGWTVEMQVKAARLGLACAEVPVRYRRRAAGKSKVSGTVKGSVQAGIKILATIWKHW
jgi:glycosyltransferase involved in cell wall biosynthesis